MEKFEMQPIPSVKARGWAVKIDGKEQTVGSVELESKFGKLIYGLRPEGYDAWVFCEAGGGGAVTIPVSVMLGGKVFVGLILEKRANMGDKPVWCAIGGFLDPGETHEQTQVREAAEESGLNTMSAKNLPGLHINSNRAFFVADAASEGTRAYVLNVPEDMLELDGGECWKLKASTLLPGFKKSGDVRFFEINEAILRTADALALAAMAKVMVLMS